MKNRFLLVVASFLALGLFFILGSYAYKKHESDKLSFVANENFKTFVPDYSPRLGPLDAPVYLVEFLDPECESCRMFYPYVKRLLKDFEGKVQLVVRYAPFHGNSEYMIKILEAARIQGKYWEALEVLFRTQPEWGSHHHPRPELVWHHLLGLGMDMEKIRQDMNDPKILEMIAQDKRDGEVLGVRGTPTFFVDGKPLATFSQDSLRDQISQAVGEKNQ